MTFRYTKKPITQGLLVGAVLVGVVALATTQSFADGWAAYSELASDRVLLVGGLLAVHTLIFWPLCWLFHRADTQHKPHWIARHRIQRERRKHPPLGKAVRVLLRNQFIYLPVLLWLTAELLRMRGWSVQAQLPSVGQLLLDLLLQAACALVVFYSAHRFLHRKWWMKRVHQVHHQFKTTTAFASEYAHPVEFIVGNFLTLAAGALIFAPHMASVYLFAAVSLITIIVHHSGYAIPWAPWSVPHDWHHFRVKEMFGTTGLIDGLLGTDEEFRTLSDGDQR